MGIFSRKKGGAYAAPADTPASTAIEQERENKTREKEQADMDTTVTGRLETLFAPKWSTDPDAMLKFVYNACDENEWFETWPGRSSLVAVRSHLDYACFPAPEGDNFLYTEVAKVLQPEVVMMMCSGLVEEFLANVPVFIDDVKLSDDLHIQIVDEIANLRYIRRHQYACFVRERHCLLLWADDARKLIPFASQVEELLVNRMWRTKDEKESWRKEPEVIDRETANLDGDRPTQLLLPFMVTCSVLINFLVLMLATRNIVKISLETKTYYRFAFLLYTPLQFVFTGFFTLMLVVAVLNCIGPIGHMFENSRHYSCKPPIRMTDNLPHVTIQCPVYKEDLADVIIPTVESLKIAISTYEKQGGSASIFINDDGLQLISEEERRVRRAFYEQNEIGWVARPGHGVNGFVRAGRFKKASNMNFAMNVSLRVEEKLELVDRHAEWTDDQETKVYQQALEEVLADIKATTGHTGWAGGNIRIGELILIVDSDTRVPEDCFLDAVSEFNNAPQVAILQHDCGVMQVSWDFWENAITYFTRCIYFSLQYATAAGDTAAFVGHNAFLRWSALQQVAYWDDTDGRQKWWSEEHVSEDFEMSLKLQGLGYISRYATYSNKGFQEGVSLTVYDELARWSKYAYGCSELVFNPFKDWLRHGPFTTIFKTFIKSDLNSYSKVTMIFYIGTYYAIALWPLLIVNLFAVGWGTWKLEKGWGFYNEGFGIFISVLIVFNIISPITNAIVRYRARGGKFLEMLYDNFKWSVLLIVFLGGLSMHLSHALVAHMCSMKMEWGATAKSLESGDFKSELPKIWKQFRWIYIALGLLAALQIVLAVALPPKYRILSITANGPLIFLMLMHGIMPFILNPNSYASEWHADAKATIQQTAHWFKARVDSVKEKLADLNLISLGERDHYRRI